MIDAEREEDLLGVCNVEQHRRSSARGHGRFLDHV